MATNNYIIKYNSGEIVRADIFKSKDGYNYASLGIKRGNDCFMTIGCEWKGNTMPDFVMDVVSHIQSNTEQASVNTDNDFEDFMSRFKDII